MMIPDDEELYEDAWRSKHPREARWPDIPEDRRHQFRAEHDTAELLAQWMLKQRAKREASTTFPWLF